MADTKSQIWDVPVSLEQRFALFNLAFHKDATIESAADGKSFRRMARAFGLTSIRDAFKRQGGVPIKATASGEKRLFKVTAENVDEVLKKLAKRQRSAGAEMELGELFDLLEDAQTSGQREEWLTVPRFDEEEDTVALKLPDGQESEDVRCPSCGQDFALAEGRAAHDKARPLASAESASE
jgi:hypothetical protein